LIELNVINKNLVSHFLKKIEMLFLSIKESKSNPLIKMINHCVSQQSISKQILVNNLRLVPDLSNIIKEFIFYDKVSQVSRDVKNYVIDRLNLVFDGSSNSKHGPSPSSYVEDNGMMMTLEGYGVSVITGEAVRYRHIAIKCLDSTYGLQYVICYKCGNYILSESSSAPQILCNCGVINLTDDDEEEEEEEEADANANADEYYYLPDINVNFPYEEAQEAAAYMEYAEFQEEQEEQEDVYEDEIDLEDVAIDLEDAFDLEHAEEQNTLNGA
jgi:hypothetical protein